MDRERSTMENYIFEKMPMPKAYMKLAIPVVMSMIVPLVYNMVDTYFIALTGVQELVAGVSLAAPVFTMMIAFGDIFGLGGSSLISRLFGEKREEEAKRASAFCIWGSIVFGICVSAVLLTFRGPILGFAPAIIRIFMNDPEIVANGAMMLRCQQLGMTFMAVTLVSTCVCQSVGNALGAFVLSISRQGILYLLMLLILSRAAGYQGVLLSQACADVATAVMAVGIRLDGDK